MLLLFPFVIAEEISVASASINMHHVVQPKPMHAVALRVDQGFFLYNMIRGVYLDLEGYVIPHG